MLRSLCACAALFLVAPLCAQEARAVEPAKSLVYVAHSREAPDDFRPDPDAERRMVDRLVQSLTGQRDVGKAWQMLVRPDDRVGIKVTTAGGRIFSSSPGIVSAIVSGLQRAGLPASRIVVWDRWSSQLQAAGYSAARLGCRVEAIDPPAGFDAGARFSAPMLGTLIWGDLSFEGQENPLGRPFLGIGSQVSAESHFARIVSKEVTRIVNVPTFCDERGCGVAGAFYNVTVPNVDNSRRFTQGGGPSFLCDLFMNPNIGPKVTLTIVDGWIAQYAGGPEFNPNYAVAHHTVYAARDPVALDATLLRQLEEWRKPVRLPPIGEHAAWLQEAETLGLGVFEPDRIALVPVEPPSS